MDQSLIVRGWINIEHLKCGLPGEHFKTKEHRFLVIRSNPTKLYRHSHEPVFVKVTIERETHVAKTFKFSKARIHEETNGFKNAKPASSYIGPDIRRKNKKALKNRADARRVRKPVRTGQGNTYGI